MHIVVPSVEQVPPQIQIVVILQVVAVGQVPMAAVITAQNVVIRVQPTVVAEQ